MSFLTKKKAPAASRQPRKIVFFPENVIFDSKKGACGKPPAGGKWFWSFLAQKKAPAASRQPRKMVKNTKIVTKWSNSGRYGLGIGSKWSKNDGGFDF